MFFRKRLLVLILLIVSVFSTTSVLIAQEEQEIPSAVGLEMVADGLVHPLDLEQPTDGSNRLFVVEQTGQIRVIADGDVMSEPFLDISDKLVDLRENYDERGLLGLALHPDFTNNGRFFVYYSAPLANDAPADWNHTSHLAEYRVMDDNPNQADVNSERILLTVNQPQMNHNAGDIVFGSDGYLYVPLGDGGNRDDEGTGHTENIGNAQDTSKLLGSILRLDVDNGDPYAIPDDNPYLNDNNVPDEIWAVGFRNPWSLAFDEETNELFVADLGQNRWEEVNIVESGQNYGWRLYEGTHCFDPQNPRHNPLTCNPETDTVMPIIEWSHLVGNGIIGGDVYRGSLLSEAYQGLYFMGTHGGADGGALFIAVPPSDDMRTSNMWDSRNISVYRMMPDGSHEEGIHHSVLAISSDANHELYVFTAEGGAPTAMGTVWRVVMPPEDVESEGNGH